MRHTLRFLWTHPVLTGRPIYAFGRFLLWQLRSRLLTKPIEYAWIGPAKLWLRRGWTGVTGNYYAGLHEFEDMGFLLHFLRPDDLFADVGANMGSYTVLAGAVRQARVYAYEPIAETNRRLEQNISLNRIEGRVVVRRCAVGAANGSVRMTCSHDATNHVIPGRDEGETVSLVALDVDLTETPILFKIDVEGYESEVLQGMTRHLANPGLMAIIIELNGSGERFGMSDAGVHGLLLSAGFRPYRYSPLARRLTPLATHGVLNTLYCRDVEFVERRLCGSAAFTALGRIF